MANDTIPTLQWLSNQIEKLDTDLLRQMLKVIAEFLMGLDADGRCGAAFGQKSDQRVNHRNGYRQRRGTRASARSRWSFPDFARAATFLNGCWRRDAGPRKPWSRWSVKATSTG